MGCDGGSIPTRVELVKEKKKKKLPDKNSVMTQKWFHCALSKKPLNAPIVADRFGTLYNREAILEHLLNPEIYGDADTICPHIKSLKDIVTLKTTPSLDKIVVVNSTTATDPTPPAAFMCPVTMKEMNGKHKFVYSPSCGCVLSESAVKEISTPICLNCNKPLKDIKFVLLNPSAEEREQLADLYAKKKKRKAVTVADGVSTKRGKPAPHGPTDAIDILKQVGRVPVTKTLKQLFGNGNPESSNFLCRSTFNRYAV